MANQYTRNPHIDHFLDNGVSIAQNAIKENYFSGQKSIKQGMGIAMLAYIASTGL